MSKYDNYGGSTRTPFDEFPETAPIVKFDPDDAWYVGDENDGVYYQVAEGADGWYMTAVVDSDSGSFVDNLTTDDGPYDTERAALDAGRCAAKEWCIWNDVSYDDEGCE